MKMFYLFGFLLPLCELHFSGARRRVERESEALLKKKKVIKGGVGGAMLRGKKPLQPSAFVPTVGYCGNQ